METTDPGGPLSDAEIDELKRLLARYATHDVDQWDNWRIHTPHGPAYVIVSQARPPDWPDEAFTTIWPPRLPELQPTPPPARWTVWRQDDNGNQYVVSHHDSRAEADTVAAEMEARGHKQTYWVARQAI